MSKRAVILAGGLGTRLKPYTVVLPKPLMPIGDYPILEVIIKQLAKHGFDHVTLAVNYQAELFRAFFSDGSKWGLKIDYSHEDRPLSTMGPLKLIQDLPDDFLVMNGDILTDLDYSFFYINHIKQNNLFSISSYKREQKIDYGVLEIDENQYLKCFSEKPIEKFDISMGIYMMNKKVLDIIPPGILYGFDKLMIDLIKKKKPAKVFPFEGYWLDIGRADDYMIAIEKFENMKESLGID
ncbi:MAG: NTP transferase domain-containing protein [Endozoicomonadaceae bacterium]|nr:NTP transferase domain-containing protein [Endozoicomonadaceae bacterium]